MTQPPDKFHIAPGGISSYIASGVRDEPVDTVVYTTHPTPEAYQKLVARNAELVAHNTALTRQLSEANAFLARLRNKLLEETARAYRAEAALALFRASVAGFVDPDAQPAPGHAPTHAKPFPANALRHSQPGETR